MMPRFTAARFAAARFAAARFAAARFADGRFAAARLATGLLAAGLLTACQASAGTEPVKSGTSQPFQVGQSYKPYPDGALVVSFQSVDNDSRCPTSVTCVWAGSAKITLGVQMGTGPTVPTSLTWGLNNGSNRAMTGGVQVTFDSLTPWPSQPGTSLAQTAYTAWLTFRPAPLD